MRLKVSNEKEFWAGLVFMLIGAAALSQIPDYKIGRPTNMGPGYFPMLIAIVLVLLGAVAAFRGLTTERAERIGRWPIAPLVFVTLGALAFAFLLERAGLALAVLALITSSCYGRLWRKPIEVALIFVVMLILTIGIFIYGIKLPVSIL